MANGVFSLEITESRAIMVISIMNSRVLSLKFPILYLADNLFYLSLVFK